MPVVLVTDGNPRIQRAKIAALGLEGRLDHVVVSDELGGRAVRKPHPAPFLRALDLLDLPPGHVVHVGDRPAKDVAGAQGGRDAVPAGAHGEYADAPDPAGLRALEDGRLVPGGRRAAAAAAETPGPVSAGTAGGHVSVMRGGPASGRLVRWFRFTPRSRVRRPGDRSTDEEHQ